MCNKRQYVFSGYPDMAASSSNKHYHIPMAIFLRLQVKLRKKV